jgi:nitroimidazol reductase NimA-like FMN-containing flavoprotein (pyridoxamine 5'-phosphate oxidase superfamily)
MDLSTRPNNGDSLAMSAPNELRRGDLVMDEAGIEALLLRGFCGRLATVGSDGMPYCTTLLFLWMDGRLYMHGTRARGHLRDNIEHEPRACFVIDEPGEVFDYGRFECDSTVSYASVVAFGRVTIVDDIAIKQRFFAALMAKYRTGGAPRPKGFFPRIEQIALYQLAVDRMTGKQIVLPDMAGQWPALDRSKTPNARPPA